MSESVILAGRYELRGILGRGGMADVHDGWDRRLARSVAVKVLRPELAAAPDTRRRFETEARLAATLNHPNVVAVHDSGEDAGVPYIVMERLPGRTLADDILGGALPTDRVRAILADVLAAVAAAHDAGILHRDIKPGNVLFSATGAVKVTDFGIAKSADTDLTSAGQVLGTVAYLSPDRIAGKPAAVTDDLYSVGVVGYEALAGHRPFVGDNILSLARSVLDGRPVPLGRERPDADPALVHAVERAMAREPQERFGGAWEMRSAVLGAGPGSVAPAAPPPTRHFTPASALPAAGAVPQGADAEKSSPPRLALALLAAVVVALVVGVLAVAASSRDSNTGPALDPATSASPTPTSLPVSSVVGVPAPVPVPAPPVSVPPVSVPPISEGAPVPNPPPPNDNSKPKKDKSNGNNGNGGKN
ncbi:MAG: serine/threonine-protein kinase [Rhodococcus sp. (in: high G+C Gram-positive bacteria)]|uniref:serine/threonine-protein kinase n=1 Tax=Rhodococcus sp. TaxID=1831 RepID=UPI003BB11270